MKRKSVLITGANGFVGRYLINALKHSEWDIIPLVHRETGLPDEVVVDFCTDDLNHVLSTLPEVDVIVHLGAKIGWDNSSKEDLFVPNVLATAEIANFAKKMDAYFIFASAVIVCGIREPLINAESMVKLDSDYGYTKWLGEEIIKMSGVSNAILRISGIFGMGGPQHLGLNRSISEALKGNPPLQYGNGKIRRNYIYVEDLVDTIIYCMENHVEGTHIVSGSSVITIADMLQIICDKMLFGTHPMYLEGKDGQDQIATPSPALPQSRSFEEAIEHIYEGYAEK